MGDVIHLNSPYRHTVPAVQVTLKPDRGYDPSPAAEWTPVQNMAWLAGVASAELGQEIVLRRTSKTLSSMCLFSIQIGRRHPVEGLQLTRVLDILAGVMTAVELLRDR